MSTKLSMIRDINGYNTFGLPFSDLIYSANIAALVSQTLTVPSESEYWLAIFAYQDGVSVWVANNQTAAIPAGASFAQTTSERNPIARLVKGGDVLSFITADTTALVGVTLYAI